MSKGSLVLSNSYYLSLLRMAMFAVEGGRMSKRGIRRKVEEDLMRCLSLDWVTRYSVSITCVHDAWTSCLGLFDTRRRLSYPRGGRRCHFILFL